MNDAFSHMKMQMDERSKLVSEKKNSYNSRVQESLLKDKELREIQQKLKTEKHQYQEDYASYLKGQMQNKTKETMVTIQNAKIHDAISKLESSPKPMIPGLYNLASVGTRPIYRTGVLITNSPNLGGSAKYDAASMESKGKSMKEQSYNTITNPYPTLTSNPYILREMQKYK